MRITKFGHSCLLVEESGVRILLDPGHWSTAQNDLANLDAVLITHEHNDHCDVSSIKAIRVNNPAVSLYANSVVVSRLAKEGINAEILGDSDRCNIRGVSIAGKGIDHIEIHREIPLIRNTGYLIADRFFHPGDAYVELDEPIEILALPVGGPWLKMSDTIDYALQLNPKHVIPIHDGMFRKPDFGTKWPTKILNEHGIQVHQLVPGDTVEII